MDQSKNIKNQSKNINVSSLATNKTMIKKPTGSISIQEEIISRDKNSKERKSVKNAVKPKVELNSDFAAMTNAFFAANVKSISD